MNAATLTTDPQALRRKVRRDLRILARFVQVYCDGRHGAAARAPVPLKNVDVLGLYGRPVRLCAACGKLLAHATVKRMVCPMDPKPMCKNCPEHCYTPRYRAEMRQVMRYAGQRLVLRGRLDYLLHLLG